MTRASACAELVCCIDRLRSQTSTVIIYAHKLIAHHLIYRTYGDPMSNRATNPKSPEQTQAELNTALSNLRAACESWELGEYGQSVNIAGILRLLLLEGKHPSTSLLKQVGLKNGEFFTTPAFSLDCAGHQRRALARPHAEAATDATGKLVFADAKWVPHYHLALQGADDPLGMETKSEWSGLPFAEWWEEEILYSDGHSFTRHSLVRSLANRLGGVHSDTHISDEEQNLLDRKYGYGFSGFSLQTPDGAIEPKNKVYEAVIRQIAYELQRTLCHNAPGQFAPDIVVPPLPPDWVPNGTGVRVRIPHDAVVYQQFLDADGPWSGSVERMRGTEYWGAVLQRQKSQGLW